MCDALQLDCPLKLIRFVKISDCGKTTFSLKSCSSSQILKFKSATCLIDHKLTLVIPKYIEDPNCNKYIVSIKEIIIQDLNSRELNIQIIEAADMCGYYLIIPITEAMFDESNGCDLILEIIKFDLDLCPSPTSKTCECETCYKCHKYNSDSKCNVDFKWIASV